MRLTSVSSMLAPTLHLADQPRMMNSVGVACLLQNCLPDVHVLGALRDDAVGRGRCNHGVLKLSRLHLMH